MERQYLLKRDPADGRDANFPYMSSRTAFPKRTNNRAKDFPEILNQYWLGACTGYAITAAGQVIARENSPIGAYHYLNPLYLYRKERELMGTTDYDSGAYIRDGLKIMKNFGCCTISRYAAIEEGETVTLDLNRFREQPTQEAEENAAAHKINSYHRIMQVHQIKQALADGDLVVMGIEIYNSFESEETARTGFVSMPDKGVEYSLGGHAVLAYDYDEDINGTEYIICRNSWGKEWGDNGFFYLPMAFIGRYVSDMWVVK